MRGILLVVIISILWPVQSWGNSHKTCRFAATVEIGGTVKFERDTMPTLETSLGPEMICTTFSQHLALRVSVDGILQLAPDRAAGGGAFLSFETKVGRSMFVGGALTGTYLRESNDHGHVLLGGGPVLRLVSGHGKSVPPIALLLAVMVKPLSPEHPEGKAVLQFSFH